MNDRQLIRIALAIQEQLSMLRLRHYSRMQEEIQKVLTGLEELQRIRQKLTVCARHNWHAAALSLKDQATRIISRLPYTANDVKWMLDNGKTSIPSLKDLLADISQIEDEFGEPKLNRDTRELSVITDRIELEGIDFGDFEIRLHINNLGAGQLNSAFSVIALNPHPAASNRRITHPHVNDEQLCTGDGRTAIQAALHNGRICDFFTLVRSVLENYNPDSPFIPIADWEGVLCSDCGYTMSDNDVHGCYVCGQEFCDDCISYCRRCDESVCHGCLEDCPSCDESFCSNCMTTCPKCGRPICKTCLEENLCVCTKDHKENTEDGSEDRTDGGAGSEAAAEGQGAAHAGEAAEAGSAALAAVGAGAAVPADGLREAAVSAAPGRHGGRRVRRGNGR